MSQYGSDPNQPDQSGQAGQPEQPYGTPPSPPNPYGDTSGYGQPPTTPPSGQEGYGSAPDANPYGAPAPNPYGAAAPNPYGGTPVSPYGQPVSTPPAGYASWIKRVGATLVDAICAILAGLPLWIGYGILIGNTTTTTNPDGTTHTSIGHGGVALLLVLIGLVTYIAFWIWNICLRQGKTGYTIGKGTMGIRLIDEQTGAPIGALMSFLRQIVHFLDGLCYIGYLWPLWDAKKQTFADKILHTIVVNQSERG